VNWSGAGRRSDGGDGAGAICLGGNAGGAWVRKRWGPGATLSERLDDVVTHKIWGWIVFAGVMTVVFFTVFRVAELPMGWIESAQQA
jgi:hypothetical protein